MSFETNHLKLILKLSIIQSETRISNTIYRLTSEGIKYVYIQLLNIFIYHPLNTSQNVSYKQNKAKQKIPLHICVFKGYEIPLRVQPLQCGGKTYAQGMLIPNLP